MGSFWMVEGRTYISRVEAATLIENRTSSFIDTHVELSQDLKDVNSSIVELKLAIVKLNTILDRDHEDN